MRNNRLEFIGIICHKAAKIKFHEQLPEENVRANKHPLLPEHLYALLQYFRSFQ